MQAEVLFLVHLLGLNNPAYESLNLRNEPNQDKRIHHVETGVEGSQHKTQLGGIGHESVSASQLHRHIDIVTNPATDHVDKRAEDKQNPHHTEDIEEHMGQSSTASLGIG